MTNLVLIYDSEITTDMLSDVTVAKATIPCILKLQQSQIPDAGNGIFTKCGIPKGYIFGPYKVNYCEMVLSLLNENK